MHSIHHILKKILFPVNCLVCKKGTRSLCQKCLRSLPLRVHTKREDATITITVFPYQDKIISRLIWELKYKNNQELREILLTYVTPLIKKEIIKYTINTDKNRHFLGISVPHSKNDTHRREFNHGFLLLKTFQQKCLPWKIATQEELFIKTTSISQAHVKTRTARIKNIQGHIQYNPNFILSQMNTADTLLILDDVTTTGATKTEIIKLCRKKFSQEIIFITLAY